MQKLGRERELCQWAPTMGSSDGVLPGWPAVWHLGRLSSCLFEMDNGTLEGKVNISLLLSQSWETTSNGFSLKFCGSVEMIEKWSSLKLERRTAQHRNAPNTKATGPPRARTVFRLCWHGLKCCMRYRTWFLPVVCPYSPMTQEKLSRKSIAFACWVPGLDSVLLSLKSMTFPLLHAIRSK